MKNAPTTNSSESAPDKRNYTPGTFPKKTDTVRAAALAAMLDGESLTGMDSVFKHSTTRLSSVICDGLEKLYNWPVKRTDLVVGTSDGRIVTIVAYWLDPETISRAFDAGACDWVKKVNADRAKRRKQASKCKANAAGKNAVRRQVDPRQGNLWGEL